MLKLLKSKLALGTPVASLILLIVAILLSSITTYFAVNIVGTRMQGDEHLYLTKCSMWFKNSSFSVGSMEIVNTGATDVVLGKITIHGQDVLWNGTSTYVMYNKTTSTLDGELPYVETFDRNAPVSIQVGNGNYTLQQAEEGMILKSGWTAVLYIVNPEDLMVYNVGREIQVTVLTAQAVWTTETVVKAAA
jgi:hypothetical protein